MSKEFYFILFTVISWTLVVGSYPAAEKQSMYSTAVIYAAIRL